MAKHIDPSNLLERHGGMLKDPYEGGRPFVLPPRDKTFSSGESEAGGSGSGSEVVKGKKAKGILGMGGG